MCTPGDLGLLPVALDAAAAATPMSESERAAAIATAADWADIFPLPT